MYLIIMVNLVYLFSLVTLGFIIETSQAGGPLVANIAVSASFPAIQPLAAGGEHNHVHVYKCVSQGS